MHDVQGLAELFGGRAAMRDRLDIYFQGGHNQRKSNNFGTDYTPCYETKSEINITQIRMSQVIMFRTSTLLLDIPTALPKLSERFLGRTTTLQVPA